MSIDPRNPCPTCGGPKSYGARRCKNCPRVDVAANGHNFAKRWFPMPELCEACEKVPPVDRHHRDGNSQNNDPSNIAFLCRRCHMAADGRLEFVRTAMPSMGGRVSKGNQFTAAETG